MSSLVRGLARPSFNSLTAAVPMRFHELSISAPRTCHADLRVWAGSTHPKAEGALVTFGKSQMIARGSFLRRWLLAGLSPRRVPGIPHHDGPDDRAREH